MTFSTKHAMRYVVLAAAQDCAAFKAAACPAKPGI